MATYYHVAPKSAEAEILASGILSLAKQFRNDESAALDAWMTRWAGRMGRSVEEIECLSADGNADLNRVCVFVSLVQARAWAAAENSEMVIFQIADEDGFLADDLRDDYSAAEGEEGALYLSYTIDPEYLSVVA